MNYKKTLPWGCMLTSFSMLSGIPEEELIKELGHNGGERVNDSLHPFRGFHWQEFIPVLLKHDIALVTYDFTSQFNEGSHPIDLKVDFNNSVGVIYGKGRRYYHCFANFYGVLIDPDTGEKPTLEMAPLMYWRLLDVKV